MSVLAESSDAQTHRNHRPQTQARIRCHRQLNENYKMKQKIYNLLEGIQVKQLLIYHMKGTYTEVLLIFANRPSKIRQIYEIYYENDPTIVIVTITKDK